MNDGRILEIGFKIDGCNTQSEFSELIKREGVFYSGDKESALENENPTGPTHVDMTEDSIKYAKEWMKANLKTFSASITDGNEITVLFGK